MNEHEVHTDERVRALRRRALLAERLLVDLGRSDDPDVAVGSLVQALTTVAGSASAELLRRPVDHDPCDDTGAPAVVLARSHTTTPGEFDDDLGSRNRHRVVDVALGLELIVVGDGVPPVAVDRSLAAVGAVLRRIDRERELLREARTDMLTGLLNRRAIFERIGTELARIERSGDPLSLLVIDLDDFKAVNDAYGHAAGDDVLRTVAETMTRVARAADDAARLGGDEFALLLPDTRRDGADAAAQRLAHELGRPDRVVRASIGVATVDGGPVPSVGELLRRADDAMYRAKRTEGRVIGHAEQPPRDPSG